MLFARRYESPLGGITLASDGEALTGLWFDGQKHRPAGLIDGLSDAPLTAFDQAERWLDIYFGGGIPDFTPPISTHGTAFREKIWNLLLAIPYGETTTYGALGVLAGMSRNSGQAVGNAIGHNPIALIIPCHRVMGSDGSLTGYAGGLDRKTWLLGLERTHRSV